MPNFEVESEQLAGMIDHTLLDPAATPGQVALLCGEASVLGVGAVCVAPNRLLMPSTARMGCVPSMLCLPGPMASVTSPCSP